MSDVVADIGRLMIRLSALCHDYEVTHKIGGVFKVAVQVTPQQHKYKEFQSRSLYAALVLAHEYVENFNE